MNVSSSRCRMNVDSTRRGYSLGICYNIYIRTRSATVLRLMQSTFQRSRSSSPEFGAENTLHLLCYAGDGITINMSTHKVWYVIIWFIIFLRARINRQHVFGNNKCVLYFAFLFAVQTYLFVSIVIVVLCPRCVVTHFVSVCAHAVAERACCSLETGTKYKHVRRDTLFF